MSDKQPKRGEVFDRVCGNTKYVAVVGCRNDYKVRHMALKPEVRDDVPQNKTVILYGSQTHVGVARSVFPALARMRYID